MWLKVMWLHHSRALFSLDNTKYQVHTHYQMVIAQVLNSCKILYHEICGFYIRLRVSCLFVLFSGVLLKRDQFIQVFFPADHAINITSLEKKKKGKKRNLCCAAMTEEKRIQLRLNDLIKLAVPRL